MFHKWTKQFWEDTKKGPRESYKGPIKDQGEITLTVLQPSAVAIQTTMVSISMI